MCRKLIVLLIAAVLLFSSGCSKQGAKHARQAPLGSPENPIKMALVPSLDTRKLIASGEKLAELLKKYTGLTFEVTVPTSYAAVVSAMGAGKVDVGWLSPLPYVIAHDQYGVRVVLRTIRDNSDRYWS
ncbi:MAG: PhnD/SsuA/transferrin family substrate-binding protein, partial [Armatimonadota bacterium]|nr:PhnD/SsuA/transferrin family substrate-binding protein [Armatimonadota bacterium]